ncbi:MAG: putative LPS assembly protein LptD [Candidatus Krumholzibacteriia bacterium]
MRSLLPAAAAALGLLAGAVGGAVPVGAADPPARTERVRTQVDAERGVDRIVDGERISYLYGNVFIDRDTVTAAADTGIVYRDRGRYELYGNVRLTDRGAVLTSRRAVYVEAFAAGDFFGDVRVVDGEVVGTGRRGESREGGRLLRLIGDALLVTPDYTVRADTVERDRSAGVGEAFGAVRIMEPEAQNLVTGEHALFLEAEGVAEVDRKPVLTSSEQSGGPLVSTAGLMRFYRAEDRVVMIDSVRIRQGRTSAAADTAVAYGRERMVLTGAPSVGMGGRSTMYGERIEFLYRERKLHRVILTGQARMEDSSPDSLAAVYAGLPRMDVLEGDSISVEFVDDEIDRTVVVGRARSIYTPLELEEEVATNDVRGDTIVIRFRDERVDHVDVRGNMSGTYRFARVAAMRELLGRSRRLADLLARGGADSTAIDSLAAAAGDTAAVRAALADSLVRAQIDSLARSIGLVPPAAAGTARPALVDSLLTAALDSLAAAGLDTSRSNLDFLATSQDVKYAGGALAFGMRDMTIDISDQGVLEYGTMELTADHIKLDTRERELYAEGEPLVKDAETIAGERMGYNFRHKTAAVQEGVTSFDEYYYVGDEIRRFEDTTLKICGGRMTSCDLDRPHYHFWADKMKMRMEDKVVAAPIVLRIGRVPVFALPFYYKSLKQGRQSGILFPSFDFGWSSREGRYIRDFGYYWATSEYTDFVFEGDYNERRDLGWRVSNRYNKRYTFQGGADYSRKQGLGNNPTSEWQLRWNHNQPTLFDDYQFRADVRLASTKLSSNDLSGSANRDIVSGQLKSSVFVSRNWSFMSGSLNAVRDERTNAEDDNPATDNLISTMTLPALSLNFRQFTLAPQRTGPGKGSLVGEILRSTYFSQGYSLNASRSGYELRTLRNYQAQGSWSLSTRPPRLGIFNLSGTASAAQTWRRQEIEGRRWVAGVEADSIPGYFTDAGEVVEETNPSLSLGLNLGTTLYGLFPVRVGSLRAIRHTMRLSTGWTVRPGLPGHQANSTAWSFSLGNRFDVKYATAAGDTGQTEKKLDGVLDWDLGTSYNPKAPADRRWSDIRSGLTLRPGQAQYLKLRVNNVIDPYALALKSTNFTYGLNFGGRLDTGAGEAPEEEQRSAAIDRLGLEPAAADTLADGQLDEFGQPLQPDQEDDFFGDEADPYDDFYDRPGRTDTQRQRRDDTEGGRYIPFDVGFNMSYSYTNTARAQRQRTSAGVNFSANLTRDWEFRYNASFDLVAGSTVRQQFSLNRDLHCWRLEFNRTVSDVDSSFGFRLYLISIPDLKFTRGREDYMGSVGGGLGAF